MEGEGISFPRVNPSRVGRCWRKRSSMISFPSSAPSSVLSSPQGGHIRVWRLALTRHTSLACSRPFWPVASMWRTSTRDTLHHIRLNSCIILVTHFAKRTSAARQPHKVITIHQPAHYVLCTGLLAITPSLALMSSSLFAWGKLCLLTDDPDRRSAIRHSETAVLSLDF